MPLRQRFAPKLPGNTAATPAVWVGGLVQRQTSLLRFGVFFERLKKKMNVVH
jgi:hypothetical protein